ncbi:MAG: AAA family ATPase, partial [Chloroflexota bacterium]|nr:AAA family ATPase [Chloroflexota bacterium]
MEPHTLSPTQWIVQTKLQLPRLRDDLVARPRLLAALHKAVRTHRLTLVSAPAGYGKTTLLAALPRAYPQLSMVWLTLDEEENDPVIFMSAFVAALQRLDPAYGVSVQSQLADPSRATLNLRWVAGLLINDILATQPAPFVVVLDDLHRISNPAIHDALDYLLEHLPPSMHLAVTTRHDPPLSLACLRARGQLAEFRLPSLSFRLEETSTLLFVQFLLDLPLSALRALQ